jgi:cell division protein FtsB
VNVSNVRESRRDDVGLRRRAAVLGAVIALAAVVVGSFFGDRGFMHVMAQRERAQVLAREVQDLRSENARLVEQIHALRTEARAVETIARVELGLARPGEMVFLVREAASSSRP